MNLFLPSEMRYTNSTSNAPMKQPNPLNSVEKFIEVPLMVLGTSPYITDTERKRESQNLDILCKILP